MDSMWNKTDFADFLRKEDSVNELDLSSMINDIMPNEEYPYHMQFSENLAELSQNETEQMLEDAISLSSATSPFSDEFSSPNMSTQNSPGAISNGEEYFYNPTLPFDIKQEDLSPKCSGNNLIEKNIDGFLQEHQVAEIIPPMNDIGMAPVQNNFPLSLNTKLNSEHVGCMQSHQPVSPATNNVLNLNDSNAQFNPVQNVTDKETLMQIIQGMTGGNKSKADKLIEPLQKFPKGNHKVGHQLKEKSQSQKKGQKAKRQRLDLENQIDQPSKHDALIQEKSQAPSQVLMLPQVVFANGNGQNVTSQPAVTAYLTSNKTVMTAVPIKILNTNTEVEKIPINPLTKKNSEISNGKRGEKIERKTNHNEVEKRYRKSITSSLEELKDLVFGSDTKSTKAGILKKAMEHIKHLRRINQRLKQENMQLKMAQKQTSLIDLVKNGQNIPNETEKSMEDFTGSFTSEDDEIEMSEDEDEEKSADEKLASPTDSVTSVESVQGGAFSMRNKQRFFLSMFMFVFMFIGPSKFLFGSDSKGSSLDYKTPHVGGRTILSLETEEDRVRGYTKLIVNSVLYLLFFAWLLIKGEPRYPNNCKQLSLYKTYLKMADREIKQADYTTASLYIERSLHIIGRPLSMSRLDMIVSLIWHSLSHILHQIGILPLLKSVGWLILPRRLSLTKAVHRYRSSCSMAAHAYSKLLDLALLDKEKRKNTLLCAKLSVAAINMAENAEGIGGDLELLIKTYINSAILIRSKIGVFAKPFMHYFLSRASSALSQHMDNVPDAFNWLFHPAGQAFLLSNDWSLGVTVTQETAGDPLHSIGHQFLMHQVEKTLKHMMIPTSSEMNLRKTEDDLSVLKQCVSRDNSVAKWWHAVLSSVYCTQHGLKSKAKQAWECAYDTFPESNSLACDLYDILDCYFNVQDELETEELEVRLQMAEDTLLRNVLFDQGKESKDELLQLLACACAEVALITRIEDWELSNSNSLTTDKIGKFEQDLNILHELSETYASLGSKVRHYKKILRVMVGSNPMLLTKELLMKKKHSSAAKKNARENVPNMEDVQEAKTLLFFFKHLSSFISKYGPKGYAQQLQSAGMILEKCGMKEMTEDCKKILAILRTA